MPFGDHQQALIMITMASCWGTLHTVTTTSPALPNCVCYFIRISLEVQVKAKFCIF